LNKIFKMNLKQARKKNKLDEFVAERKNLKGDSHAFDKVLGSIVEKSKSIQETSSQDSSESCSDTQTP